MSELDPHTLTSFSHKSCHYFLKRATSMTTIFLADDSSNTSESDDAYYHRRPHVYQQVTGPSAWWRRATGQDPQYQPATVWPERPRRRRRRTRYRRARDPLGTGLRIVQIRGDSSDSSVIAASSSDESNRGRRRYRRRSLSPWYRRLRSPSPRRYRYYSPSPVRYYPRLGYRHGPGIRRPSYWPPYSDRPQTNDEYHRPLAPPPELPRPAPHLPAPPMPPPTRTRPSQLRQERGDRYADSEESRYRNEYIKLRGENIEEMDYEAEYKEWMPDWRKGTFQYRDRESREDRMEELQAILRGARFAAERDDANVRLRSGVV